MTPGNPYRVYWIDDEFGIDPNDDNVDVFVEFASGERFVATFFTLDNIKSLMAAHRETGECAHGLYLWSTHMIVVDRLTRVNVERVVADLLGSGEFTSAFEKGGDDS
jgi:hypothetical protein